MPIICMIRRVRAAPVVWRNGTAAKSMVTVEMAKTTLIISI